MELYDLEVSGNCYKIRLFLALIKQPYTLRPVDFLEGEHKNEASIERNAFGEVPVLIDGDLTLRDSQAILIYLARKFDRTDWYPTTPAEEAKVVQWLMVAESEIARGPNDARLHDKFGYELDIDLARNKSTRILDILNEHLLDRDWLELDRPTLADLACFPYVALSEEGGVSLEPYPAITDWIERIKALPDFVTMPGM
ncbi:MULTISPECIES: glutathione S-transferase family protein [unclassified Psychrobacter]|uniref:glutathione S-transferase family protein n=1 Tax=unclassified Psychrobacter TaxID=196806 RepID=UPI00071E9BCB|nr:MULTISPECIES: glutathione S-transferase [unclassified Psychrobacter]OLF37115.1 glutathione S-transferase [Psychrobacter sp. Cmf 22.2]